MVVAAVVVVVGVAVGAPKAAALVYSQQGIDSVYSTQKRRVSSKSKTVSEKHGSKPVSITFNILTTQVLCKRDIISGPITKMYQLLDKPLFKAHCVRLSALLGPDQEWLLRCIVTLV